MCTVKEWINVFLLNTGWGKIKSTAADRPKGGGLCNQESGTVELSGHTRTCFHDNGGFGERILSMPRPYSEAHENTFFSTYLQKRFLKPPLSWKQVRVWPESSTVPDSWLQSPPPFGRSAAVLLILPHPVLSRNTLIHSFTVHIFCDIELTVKFRVPT
jgi:hypothetical protein